MLRYTYLYIPYTYIINTLYNVHCIYRLHIYSIFINNIFYIELYKHMHIFNTYYKLNSIFYVCLLYYINIIVMLARY